MQNTLSSEKSATEAHMQSVHDHKHCNAVVGHMHEHSHDNGVVHTHFHFFHRGLERCVPEKCLHYRCRLKEAV